jgi:hypothetical protein
LLTAIAAFAEAFANPLAPVLALGAALLVPNRRLLRIVAGAAGVLLAFVAHIEDGPGDRALAMLGAASALLLHTEIALHLILPGLRWLWRCVATAWELAWLVLVMMGRLWARPRRHGPGSPEKDRAP